VSLLFEIRMKTGFFETMLYDLLICKNKVKLSASESVNDSIIIPDKEILCVMIIKKKLYEIEIHKYDKIYSLILCDNSQLEEIIKALYENLNTKIICECKNEGGNKNE